MRIRKPNLSSIRQKKADIADPLRALPSLSSRLDSRTKRKYTRWGLIGGNFLLLLVVAIFIMANRSASQTIRTSTLNSPTASVGSLSGPLDQLSSEQIALEAAKMVNLPELPILSNRADSAIALLSVAPNDSTILAKPQVVSTSQKSKHDIIRYTAKRNDTLAGLAIKFRVSANSIRWSNGLTTDIIQPGKKLLIPPGDGIVYKVKSNDTVGSIINRYGANKTAFIQVNDAEGGLRAGEYVWIPNGLQPTPTFAAFTGGNVGGASFGSRRFNSCSLGINNSYYCGWCTWWSAYRRSQVGNPVPPGLGDAYSWHIGLKSGAPRAGAVAQFPGNHVGFVEKLNPDGSVLISEMNREGWDVVSNRTIPASQQGGMRFLY